MRQRPRTRTGPTRARTSSAAAAGGSATRGGSAPSDAHRGTRVGPGVRGFAPSSSGARDERIPLRVPAATGAPAIVPRSRGVRTSRSGAARRLRERTCDSRSSITRREATTTRGRRPPRSCKGIQLFHVQGNGWNDIGYNFLVDRFGTIYEGRYGGVDRNVVGAHALGFNTGSVGIALLGTYGRHQAVCRLRRTRSRGSSPGGSISRTSIRLRSCTFISGGSERYASRRSRAR